MRRALSHIAQKRSELADHRFMRQLATTPPIAQVVPFVPQVSFFVLAFQDLMRITGERADDPRLRDLLRHHCEEEVGHDGWFLQDLVRLADAPPSLAILFGPQHAATRRATWALMGEVLSAEDDVARLCLIFTLEAAADVCFGEAQAYFERTGLVKDLVYFAGPHRESEAAHSLFEGEMQAIIKSIELDEQAFGRARGGIDRNFDALRVMLDGLAELLTRGGAA
jgi:hypothetical protein